MADFAVRTVFGAQDKLSPAFKRMGNEADKFGRRGSSAMGRINRAAGSVLGTLRGFLPVLSAAAVVKFANDSIEAFKKQEAAVAMVEQRLKSTNNALGLTSKELQKMAAEYERVGIFGDEDVLQHVTSQFMTFGNIGKENFDRIQRAALDVTAQLKGVDATGNDLQSTAIMMGKALDDPIRGMSAMSRVGITFSDQQRAMVKQMVKSGDTLGAQNLILAELEKQYGGTNEALAKTTAGMERNAKNKMGSTMELIGEQIVPLKQSLFELAGWILPKINAALPTVVSFLKFMAPPVAVLVGAYLAWRVAIFSVIATQKIMMVAGWISYLFMMRAAIFKAITMTKLWSVAQTALNFIMSANPIALVVLGIAALIAAGYLLIKNWGAVKEFFSGMWQGIKDGLMSAVNWIMDKFGAVVDWVANKWKSVKSFFGFAGDSAGEADAEMNRGRQAPNSAEVRGRQASTVVNVNNATPGTSATVNPRRGAVINMNRVGANP